MNHQNYYHHNQTYTNHLINRNPKHYQRYTQNLKQHANNGKILDVGSGAGQVIQQLRQQNIQAYGLEISHTNIQHANQHNNHTQHYNGTHIPYPNNHFNAVGALNVLEHTQHPQHFIQELIRVLKPHGTLILSSPNFLRVLGCCDYHPKMRGLKNKYHNAIQQLKIRHQIRTQPNTIQYPHMKPIHKTPFTPDDDAITLTNPHHTKHFIQQNNCTIQTHHCNDRPLPFPLQHLLNLPLLKNLWFNTYIIATKNPPTTKTNPTNQTTKNTKPNQPQPNPPKTTNNP